MPRSILEWQKAIHEENVRKGWWKGVEDLPLKIGNSAHRDVVTGKLLLIVTEIAEATEEMREGHAFDAVRSEDGKPCGFPTELADAVIRIFDLADACGINIDAEMERKHAYNRTRPHRHGGKLL